MSNDNSNIVAKQPELEEHNDDLLSKELEMDESITEETRYTALSHMIEEKMVALTTKIEKNKFDKIMRMLTFVRLYKLEMKAAMKASREVSEIVYADCNLYLDQIMDYFKLMKSKEGWTANEVFSILKAEEKTAKKWGIFSAKKEDAELES